MVDLPKDRGAVETLLLRRKELADRLEKMTLVARSIETELSNIDGALNILKESGVWVGDAPYRRPKNIHSAVLDILRNEEEPITSKEIHRLVESQLEKTVLRSSISAPLNRLKKLGAVSYQNNKWAYINNSMLGEDQNA